MAITSNIIERAIQWELKLCFRLNHALDQYLTRRFFALISRLGDGVLWYALMLVLPLVYGTAAIRVSLRMAAFAVLGLLLYKLIKSLTSRERPYRRHRDIKLGTHPLDQYSFPSGHTLHAVGFTTTAVAAYPELAWILLPFTILIAMSRVILGLHYPTDVIAGASIGALLAWLSITFFS